MEATMFRAKYFLISLLALAIGCSPQPRSEHDLYIGTISGPETTLVEVAKQVAAKNGLNLKIITFEDYIMPNTALVEGEIDANMFQHQPYLDIVVAKKGYELTTIGKMYVYPMGVYSKKYRTIGDIPKGAVVGIPNDPSNAARALRLLEKAQLITLPQLDDLHLTPKSITTNPKGLQFKEINAAQLPRLLNDLDFAAINTNYAIQAGLKPNQDALILEDKDSPYVNIVVVRTQDKDNPKFRKLMDALHSSEVQAKANELFNNQAIVGWE